METAIYCLKAIVCSGIMYAYYLFFLKDKTFHHYNRFYLLLLIVVSLVLPLLKIEYFTIELNDKVFLILNQFQNFTAIKSTNDENEFLKYIPLLIAGVTTVLLTKLSIGIIKINRLKNKFKQEKIQGINFYQTNLHNAPFSFFKNLFWKDSILIQSDLGKQILKHEMVHIEQKHSYDKIFVEIISSIFWFNPIFHIIKKEISLIHEYLADHKAVKKSDTKAFAEMLLSSHFSGNILPGTSPFLNSNLKKRLKMIQKPKTKYAYARRFFALPIMFTVAFAYMVDAKNKEIEKVNYTAEKIIKSLNHKNNSISLESKAENVSTAIAEDTIKPTALETSSTSTISNLKIRDVENPWENLLKDAAETDIFLVDGKKVSKDDFMSFFDNNRETPNYIFSHSARKNDEIKVMIYSAAKNNDKLSIAVRNKLMKENNVGNDMFLYMTKMQFSEEQKENLRTTLLDNTKARKAIQKSEENIEKESDKNLNFKKGRDYDKNPLTQAEIKELREDAERLRIKSEKESVAGRENMIIFKSDLIASYVTGKSQPITNDKNDVPVKANTMVMPLVDGQFFIDGKEYTKKEIKKYMKGFEEEMFGKEKLAKAPFKSVKMYRTPYGDKGFSKLDKVEFSTK